MADLGEQVVLLTGASGGIGEATARALVEEGARVTLLARRGEVIRELAQELSSRALAHPGDVTCPQDLRAAVAAAEARFGKLTALVNNAGVARYAPVQALSAQDWQEVLNVNLTGAFHAIQACVPALRRAGGGLILNVASLAARFPFPESAAYAASKAGLLALTEAAALDLRDLGIRVGALLPGSVATALTDPHEAQEWKIQPRDVAALIVDLLRLPPHVMPGHVELRPTRLPAERRRGLRVQ